MAPGLIKIWQKVRDAPYDCNVWDLFKTEFGLNWGDMQRTDKFFCSALTTFCYEQFGIINTHVPWDLIKPEDFNDKGKIDQLLIESCSLGPKLLIKSDIN